MTPVVSLFTLPTRFAEPRVGKVQAKRLEGESRSHRNCRHIYSLLAGVATIAAYHSITQHSLSPGWLSTVAVDILWSLLSWLTQWTQPWRSSKMPPLYRWSSQTGVLHKDQASTAWCVCTVLQMTSAVAWSLFAKHGAREPEHAILANFLSPHTPSPQGTIQNSSSGSQVENELIQKLSICYRSKSSLKMSPCTVLKGFSNGSVVKTPPATQEMEVWSLGQEDPLEEEMATHSSILAWESHGQRSLEGYSPKGHRVRQNWATGQIHAMFKFSDPKV